MRIRFDGTTANLIDFEGTGDEFTAFSAGRHQVVPSLPPPPQLFEPDDAEKLASATQVVLDVMSTSQKMPGDTAKAIVERLFGAGMLAWH